MFSGLKSKFGGKKEEEKKEEEKEPYQEMVVPSITWRISMMKSRMLIQQLRNGV